MSVQSLLKPERLPPRSAHRPARLPSWWPSPGHVRRIDKRGVMMTHCALPLVPRDQDERGATEAVLGSKPMLTQTRMKGFEERAPCQTVWE
jgi:hypothetical protein